MHFKWAGKLSVTSGSRTSLDVYVCPKCYCLVADDEVMYHAQDVHHHGTAITKGTTGE